MKHGDSFVVPTREREVWRRTATHMGLHMISRKVEGGNSRLWLTDTPGKEGRPCSMEGAE